MGARHFGIGVESTWGTEVAPTRFFEALSESVQQEIANERIVPVRAFSPNEVVALSYSYAGDVEMLSAYEGIGILYEHLMGSVDTTDSGSQYQHTFPASTGIPAADRIGKYFTGEFRRDGSLNWRYNGMKLTGLSHSFGVDAASRMTWSMMGKGEASNMTPGTASYPTLRVMLPQHATLTIDAVSQPARSAGITIENPLDQTFLLGSTTLGREPDRSDALVVTGEAEILFEDFVLYNKFDGTTDVDVALAATNGTEQITYNMNKCRITQGTPHMSGRERLVVPLTWESIFDATATENLQIVLINNDATP